MLPEDKKNALLSLGAKEAVFLDFNEVKDTNAEDFLSFIKEKYNPNLITCGYDFRFGKDAKGDADLINTFCSKNGISFFAMSLRRFRVFFARSSRRPKGQNYRIPYCKSRVSRIFGAS